MSQSTTALRSARDSGLRPVQTLQPARGARRAAPRGVIDKVRFAFERESRLALLFGIACAGIVPIAVFVTVHSCIDYGRALYLQPSAYFAAGGLVFSALTMYLWGVEAFGLRLKAAGWVLLLEGVMVTSTVHWLAYVTLALLASVNGIAAACNFASKMTRTP